MKITKENLQRLQASTSLYPVLHKVDAFLDRFSTKAASIVFCKKDVPKNFTKFTGKHFCRYSYTGAFL